MLCWKKRVISFKKIKKVGKGAISLFLAVLMTPFLTIAMSLVEAGRYNSAVSIMDEAMGVSSNSLLANYDTYLQQRWGTLGIDQGIDIDTKYSEYLNKNASVLGDSLSIDSMSADGMYSLADTEILYNQIIEYSKFNSPTELAVDFSNIKDLISKLEGLSNLNSVFNLITNGSDAVDSSITLAESATALNLYSNNLEQLETTYKNEYNSFKSSVSELIAALNVERPDETTDPEGALTYDLNIVRLQSNVSSAKSSYSDTLQDISFNLDNFRSKMEECSAAIASIQDSIRSASTTALSLGNDLTLSEDDLKVTTDKIKEMDKNNVDKTSKEYTDAIALRDQQESTLASYTTQQGLANATADGLSSVDESWQKSFATYNDNTIGSIITGFDDLRVKVNSFSVASVTKSSSEIDDATYHNISVGGYIKSEDINAYLDEQENDLKNGSLSAVIKGITSFFNSLLKMSLLYDPSLSSTLDVNYYEDNFGGLPGDDEADGGVLSIIHDIGGTMTAINSFKKNLSSFKLISALKNLKGLIVNIIDLVADVIDFTIGIVENIYQLFTGYDRLYYSTYSTYNLPCRTDNSDAGISFKNMSGNSVGGNLPDQTIVSSSVSMFDDLAAAIKSLDDLIEGSGEDLTFNGAELEYVLFGSKSEVANQMYVFFSLYLLRLLLDMPAVLSNPEVQALATAATIGYPVVMILIIFAEPLVDTVLLVNGADISMYKCATIFLTPSGIPSMIETLFSIVKFTTNEKDSMKSNFVESFGISEEDYNKNLDEFKSGATESKELKIFKFNYRQYCFMILLLTVQDSEQMARIKNLMQTEGTYYYSKKDVGYDFDLRKSYTYINATANISVKQTLPTLSDSSLFKIERTQYRGY